MPTTNRPTSRQFLSLRPEFLATFPWGRITRDGFRLWARTERKPVLNVGVHKWRPMREGEPVAREIIEAFSEYVGDAKHILPAEACAVSKIARPAEAISSPPDSDRSHRFTLTSSWKYIYTQMLGCLHVDDESYCTNEQDLAAVADMVFSCLAWHDNKNLSGSAALAYAESVLKRTPDEFAQTLLTYWKANEHAVLFAVMRRGGKALRVGACVNAPVTETFYQRFRVGEAEEAHISAADVVPRSPFVFAHAVAESRDFDPRKDKAKRSLIITRTILYQLASVFELVDQQEPPPRIVSLAGSKENIKRLRGYNFVATGAKTGLTGKDIVEFAPPLLTTTGTGYALALAEYLAMKSLIQVFQANIKARTSLHSE
jgi:hypothetical protein